MGASGLEKPRKKFEVLLQEVTQGDHLTGHGRLRLRRSALFDGHGTRERLDGHGDGHLMLPVVEEVADDQHGGALVEGDPVALVGVGREDDLELPVRPQLELVDQRIGARGHPRHDLQAHIAGGAPFPPQSVGRPALERRSHVDAVRALHAPLVGGVHARGLHRRDLVQPPSQELVDTHAQQDEEVAEAGGHVHRLVGDGVGQHDLAGPPERVQQVVPRLTGFEILAGGIAGRGGLAHRKGEPGRVLERTHAWTRGDGEASTGVPPSGRLLRGRLLRGRLLRGRVLVVSVVVPGRGTTDRSARQVVHPTALVNERRGSPANARTEANSSSVSGCGTR